MLKDRWTAVTFVHTILGKYCGANRAANTAWHQHLLKGPSIRCSNYSRRHISSTKKICRDHEFVTRHIRRSDMSSNATVISLTQGSSTVKLVSLKVQEKALAFKAGQWVDLKIPDVEKLGGFSIYSAPSKLLYSGMLDLAIKRSEEEPAQWIHTNCRLGSEVTIKIGGEFYCDPQPADPPEDVLLIAGGIGINPVFSILQHIVDLYRICQTESSEGLYKPGNVLLLYSAKRKSELLFKKQLAFLMEECPLLSCKLYVTDAKEKSDDDSCQVTIGRIKEEDIRQALGRLDKSRTRCFICGPTPMIEDMERALLKFGVDGKRIMYEKWW